MLSFFHKPQPRPKCMWEGELKVERKLGEGSYGDVLLVQDSDSEHFAVKTAPTNSTAARLLETEYKAYKQLGCLQKAVKGLPQIHAYGYDPRHGGNVLVMSRLGSSLRDVMELNDNSIPKYSVLRIAAQVIRRLQYIHEHSIIHGDIKPRNILCALETFERIYLVDFGLATVYRKGRAKRLSTMTTGNEFQGTIDFASRHTHRGISLSRRDDLESFAYTLVYLMKGSLPWSRNREEEYLMYEGIVKSRKPTDHLEILAQKESVPIEELCEGLPSCIESFMRYVCELEFYSDPDYLFLIDRFENGMEELKVSGDVDNGEELNIWKDPDEKRQFEWLRNEDEIWEDYLKTLEKEENADPENEEPIPQESEAEVQPHDECHQLEKDAKLKLTSKFAEVFRAWKPFGSARSQEQNSEASEVQKGPIIGLDTGRESLFERLRRVIKRGADDFQIIFLKRQEDSWSEDWELHDEYRCLS